MPTTTTYEPISKLIKRLAPSQPGPDALTKAILAEIGNDPKRMYQALTEVLPGYCRQAIGAERRSVFNPNLGDINGGSRAEDEPATQVPNPAPTDPPQPAGSAWVSKKSQAIHDWYQRALTSQYHTHRGYRFLGECTQEDLVSSAEERRHQAAGHLNEASKLEALAAALARYKATFVADLPPAVLGDIMQLTP